MFLQLMMVSKWLLKLIYLIIQEASFVKNIDDDDSAQNKLGTMDGCDL
jgi:hypothetical protein